MKRLSLLFTVLLICFAACDDCDKGEVYFLNNTGEDISIDFEGDNINLSSTAVDGGSYSVGAYRVLVYGNTSQTTVMDTIINVFGCQRLDLDIK